jgi:hypothetical protein
MQLNVPPDLETLVNKSAHIEEGYLQAERGELIDGAQARREIQGMKDNRRQAGANPVIGDPDQGRGGKPFRRPSILTFRSGRSRVTIS